MSGLIPLVFLLFSLIAPTYFVKFLLVKLNVSFRRLELGFFSVFLGQIIFASVIFLFSLILGLSWMTVLVVSTLVLIADLWIFKLEKFSFRLGKRLENYEEYFLIVLLCVSVVFFALLGRHMLFQTLDGFFTHTIHLEICNITLQ